MKSLWGCLFFIAVMGAYIVCITSGDPGGNPGEVYSFTMGDIVTLSDSTPEELFTSFSQKMVHQSGPGTLSTGTALTPAHTGDDYTFNGTYSDGQITITGSGTYHFTDNLTTTRSDYAVRIASPDVVLNGNEYLLSGKGDGAGIEILERGSNSTVLNLAQVSGFANGIYSFADRVMVHDNYVYNNTWVGIRSLGNYSVIYENTASSHGDLGIFSFGHHSIVRDNFAYNNLNGILSQGNYAEISDNIALMNSRRGIIAGGNHVGPEPGDEGFGYYAQIMNNLALYNGEDGIRSSFPHAVIMNNRVYMNDVGISVQEWSNNTTISGNAAFINGIGMRLSDSPLDLSVHDNRLIASSVTDIFLTSGNLPGSGAVYNNFLGSTVPVDGTGRFDTFLWQNPAGPQPGENIVYGPYIAGNYWSDPEGSGWSDLQDPSLTGYSTVPYEVFSGSGAYDTTPLVRIGHSVNATSDAWTINHPHGNITYPRYTDATYVTQAKPGAILNNIRVDGFLNASAPSYTFTEISDDHTIETSGYPIPGQVHVMFHVTPESGTTSQPVQFFDNSVGTPTSWFWDFGDGKTSTEKNPSHSYTYPGRYTVSLRAYNGETGGYYVCNDCVEVVS